jgi:hypothetical protein
MHSLKDDKKPEISERVITTVRWYETVADIQPCVFNGAVDVYEKIQLLSLDRSFQSLGLKPTLRSAIFTRRIRDTVAAITLPARSLAWLETTTSPGAAVPSGCSSVARLTGA